MAQRSIRQYRQLDPNKIIGTAEVLRDRIRERFEEAGLNGVAEALVQISRDTARNARGSARPYFGVIFLAYYVFPAAVIAVLTWMIGQLHLRAGLMIDPLTLVQGVEALAQLGIFFGGMAWFIFTLESRLKRSRVQGWLLELRAFAHVIDMHQLTKDPTAIMNPSARTASSPERIMTQFELARYLAYCAEMFSIIGKLSALYSGASSDGLVVAAAGDIETLCTDLGRKVWQKIMILSELDEATRD